MQTLAFAVLTAEILALVNGLISIFELVRRALNQRHTVP